MAWSISQLTGYIDENSFELISKGILKTSLVQFMNVRVGLQGNNVDLPILDSDFYVQDGANCGWNTSGDTQITQVRMGIKNNKVNLTHCMQTLRDTFLSKALAAGAATGGESIPYEELIANFYVEKLNKWNEEYIMNGDGTFSGLTDILITSNGTISGASASAWTSSNAVSKAQTLYQALPDVAALRDDVILILSPNQYRALTLGITQENYYHIAPGGEIYVPGTNCRVIASAGLVNSNKKYMGSASTLFLGTDLTSDFEQFKVWYSQDNDEVRSLLRWRIGVAVSEPALWVAEL